MAFRACVCVSLALLVSLTRAAPEFVGGLAEVDTVALENYETQQVVRALAIVDFDDFSYSIPADDIAFSDPSNQFSITIQGNAVFIIVAAPLLVGTVSVTVTLTSQSMTVTVNIDVRQTNFPPIFFSSHYFSTILESLQVGDAVITSIEAADFDPGSDGEFEYEFQNPDLVSPTFSIDPATGVITLAQSVDYEAGPTDYRFTILAQETQSTAKLSASAEVLIYVVNVNDNPPSFPDVSVYQYTISENSGVALHVADDATSIITATDGDVEMFGEVTYELTGGLGLFGVEESGSGVQLKTLADLDRETASSYTMTLIAQDGGEPPLADSVRIEVTVEDENDIAPVFSVSDYHISLFEGDAYPSFVTFHATDGDATAPNNRVTYPTIALAGDPTGSHPFELDSGTGAVSVSGLDHETSRNFLLTITAQDGGVPFESAEATLNVTVLPVNELAPVFQETIYTATVGEDLGVGEDVGVTVLATDGEGHEVRYSIHPGYQDGNHFSVSETSGVVSLALSLDRDPPSLHETFTFNVIATDMPSEGEATRTGEVQVVVSVTDVNDNAPEITEPDQSHVTLEVQEVIPPTGADLFTMSAVDIDGDSDGDSIAYSLEATDNSLLFFEMDQDSGVFQQSAVLDREACNPVPCQYQMTASACDAGSPTQMCSSISVAVTVLDFNDNAPVITNSPLTASEPVLECDLDGRLLSTVTAEDTVDTGDFAEVVFEALPGDPLSHILLNEQTGEIYLGFQPVDYDSGDREFSLSVRARDYPDGPLISQLESQEIFVQTITIGDCNDNPPVFAATQYEFTVTENMDNLVGLTAISTTDADGTAENQAVTYRTSQPGEVNWFDITADGSVFIRSGATVDREHPSILTDSQGNGVVTFAIEAVNSAPTATLTSTQNAQVSVTIGDQNDNAPEMLDPLTGTRSIVILEDAPEGSILAVVIATDPDIGTNAAIQYEITSGNDLDKFSLESTYGVLTLAAAVDFEVDPQSYTIIITATNPPPASPPPDSDEDDITLTIMVEGANEHAPEFEQDRYEREISEYNELVVTQPHAPGDIIATIFATDADANDDIQYSISGGNEDDIFEIPNPMFGNIALRDPALVDFESTTSHALLVTATDLVIPASDRKTDTTYLYITVRDENDNVPVFSSETYSGIVEEEEPAGANVILTVPITASDADSLNSSEVLEYEITAVGNPLPFPFLAFTLSEDGTRLTTTTPIDRETAGNVFTFQLTVTDTARNEDTAMVVVNITDINDNPPIIQQTTGGLFITIPENHPVGSQLRTISAVDIDLGANADFLFSMQGGAGFFEIDLSTGVVTLAASLQSLEPPVIFPLTVFARDSGGLSSNVSWSVNLTYSNDHPPIFESTTYSGSIAECVDDDSDISPVIILRATDADSNAVVSYYIESSDVGDLFRLDDRGQEADILTAGSGTYDRETLPTLTFTVYATDGVMGSDDDSATVTISLTDCNDNHPIFTQELYDVDVAEGTTSGTTVIQVHTNDADVGENQEVRFSIDSVSPSSLTNVFVVDPLTGGIVTDVEISNEYTGTSTCSSLTQQSNNITITVRATDQATLQPRLSNFTTVFIRLLDRNSEAPSFVPSSFYSFSVSENTEGVEVGVVEAVDECDQNSVVTYVLVGGEDSAPFEIDPTTGMIRLVSALDREANDLLVVQLEAVDDGTEPGPQTGYASISVSVLDENDNAPQLVRDEFERTLPENIPVGTTLVTLLASDPDLQENGSLSYRIFSGDTDLFMLEGGAPGSDSDHLVTIRPLDRETVSTHLVNILVEDGGTSPRRNDTAVMNLTLSDVNDNEPIWTAGHGTHFEIFENVSGVLIVDLDAMDIDEGLNRELVYFFVGGSQDFGPFHIDRQNGSLYLMGQLDFERTREYSLGIVVADRKGETEDDEQTPLTNSTTVLISVSDINDNLPYFNRCPHRYEVLETLRKGLVVGNDISGSVGDEDSQEIHTPFYYYLVSEEDVECNEAFCIDGNTGIITLDSDLDFETKPMYTFYMVVSDRPDLTPEEAYSSPTIDLCETVATQRNNITMVEVVLTDVNDQSPQFVSGSLLAAVAEEAEFDTTVTVLQALDGDENDTYSTVHYEIIAVDPPYLVDRETGEVTTADTFAGRSGEVDRFTVVAYDNRGTEPSFTSTAVLTVRVFKECQQVIAVADQPQEQAEACRSQLESAIANETGYIIYITKIRVHQDEQLNVVDTTRADMIFYALDHTTGGLVQPQEVISVIERALDLQEEPIKSLVDNCKTSNFKQFCASGDSSASSGAVSTVVAVAMALLGAIILSLLICLLCVCALERRKARKLRMRKKTSFEQSSNFSQFSQVATSNPMWMPPYEQWEEESTTTAAQSTALDRENPLYESQELTIEMFRDEDDDVLSVASSRGNLSKVKPPRMSSTPGAHDSVYDDYDPLADALGISGKPDDSQTSLI